MAGSFLRLQHVSLSEKGVDQFGLETFVDLVAQIVYVNLDHVGTGVEIDIPDFFGDFRFGQHAPGVAHKKFEQGKFPGREQNFLSASADGPGIEVLLQVGEPEDTFRAKSLCRAACEGNRVRTGR